MHWRKSIRLSSSPLWMRTKRVVEEGEAVSRRSCLIGIFRLGLLVPAIAGAETDRIIRFDIHRQRADQALIEFAEQADVTFIFPVDETRKVTANAVQGRFTQEAAIQELLEGTGLHPKFQPNGELVVNAGNNAEAGGPVKKRGIIASVIAALAGGTANAQDTTNTSDRRTLEEIVVTAQKREENLQDVPISISAIGGRRIEELGLQGLNDLMGMVPGVSFTSVGPGEGNLVIRGIASGDIQSTVNNRKEAVGVYINDAPVGLPRFNPDISPFDLERVEVLRGPQGTLYGSGSLAGTVRYITTKPNTQEFESKVGADLSSTKRGGINHRLDAMINVPLSDTFALRVVGYEQFDDGYIRGVGPGHLGHDENDAEQYGGRVALRWAPSERFTADASAMIQRLDSDMSAQDNEGYAYSGGVPVGPYEQYRHTAIFVRNRFNLYNLTLDYDLGWGNLTSSTSLVDNENDSAADFSPPAIQQFFGVDLGGLGLIFHSSRDLSQELRLATAFEGPLNFIGGVFYIDQDRGQHQPNPIPGIDAALGIDSTAFGAPVDTIFTQNVDIDERQVALFGELTYDLTEKLSATVGLRWFDVEQDYFIATGGIVASGNPPLSRTAGESDFNPKFLVSYAVSDDVLLSAQAARGFRLGGTNELISEFLCAADLAALGLTKAPEIFTSEHVWNYELNAKTSWLDRRLTVNGSVYYIDYKDIQILMSNLSCGFVFTDNAGSAKSRGVELELTTRPLEGLELSIGGAYTDAELTVDAPQLGGQAGDQLPMSAKFTGNATARYEFPVSGTIQGFVQYSYRYTDRILFSLNYKINPVSEAGPAPAYDLHNLRLGLQTGRWNASIYVNNVLDEEIISYEYNFFGLEHLRTRGQPRTVGLSVSTNF